MGLLITKAKVSPLAGLAEISGFCDPISYFFPALGTYARDFSDALRHKALDPDNRHNNNRFLAFSPRLCHVNNNVNSGIADVELYFPVHVCNGNLGRRWANWKSPLPAVLVRVGGLLICV